MDLIFLAVNGAFLFLTLVGAIVILRASTRHTYNMGNNPVQAGLRLTIMHTLILLLLIGLAAAAFNILYPDFFR